MPSHQISLSDCQLVHQGDHLCIVGNDLVSGRSRLRSQAPNLFLVLLGESIGPQLVGPKT